MGLYCLQASNPNTPFLSSVRYKSEVTTIGFNSTPRATCIAGRKEMISVALASLFRVRQEPGSSPVPLLDPKAFALPQPVEPPARHQGSDTLPQGRNSFGAPTQPLEIALAKQHETLLEIEREVASWGPFRQAQDSGGGSNISSRLEMSSLAGCVSPNEQENAQQRAHRQRFSGSRNRNNLSQGPSMADEFLRKHKAWL